MLAWSCGSSKTCPTYADAGQNQEKATQANWTISDQIF
jgi:hypothetical protein